MTRTTLINDWLDELPITPGPRHLRMGVRGVSEGPWLIRDALTDSELKLKARLLADHDSLVMLKDGYDDAAGELVSTMGITADGPGIDRLDIACRSVPEDVLLMAQQDSRWTLVGGWLVFPNQWTIAEKMGESLALIHDPIDGYEEMLRYKADTFFDRLGTTRIFWRRNWFFHDDPAFYQPDKMENRPLKTAEEASQLFVRSEYQTLRRLPETGVIVFTVKTQVAPIAEMCARSDLSARVVEFLSTASERSLANKDADGRHEAIIEYLSPEARTIEPMDETNPHQQFHRSAADLEAGLDHIRQSPRGEGKLELVVRRPAKDEREVLETAELDTEVGVVGDNWIERSSNRTEDGSAHPDMQLNLMNARVAELVAGPRDRWQLAGDQLYVDMELSDESLPHWTKLAIGDAVIQITDQPHNGCAKFHRRFGADALKFVNSPVGKELHLRGVNARVLQNGTIRPGDEIRFL